MKKKAACPHCGSTNTCVKQKTPRPRLQCKDCGKSFGHPPAKKASPGPLCQVCGRASVKSGFYRKLKSDPGPRLQRYYCKPCQVIVPNPNRIPKPVGRPSKSQ